MLLLIDDKTLAVRLATSKDLLTSPGLIAWKEKTKALSSQSEINDLLDASMS